MAPGGKRMPDVGHIRGGADERKKVTGEVAVLAQLQRDCRSRRLAIVSQIAVCILSPNGA
jgi:hypothetical protein